MRRLRKRIGQREQILATALLREGSANSLAGKLSGDNVAQLELEHLRMILWTHFLEDLVDDGVDVRSLLGKGERAIYDEAVRLLTGKAGWDYSPEGEE